MANLNAIVRVSVAGLLGVAGIGLLVVGALNHDVGIAAAGSAMLAGSGLTAWDTHIS